MEKEKVIVDVDDSLAEFMNSLNKYYNERFETHFHFEDYTASKLFEVWSRSDGEAIEIIYDFYKTPEFRNLKPLPYSKDVIRDLKRKKDFIALSYRPKEVEKITREWIGDFFFGIPSFCVGSYDFSPLISKLEYCLKIGATKIIEDSAKTASKCGGGGMTSILLTKPWNQNTSLNSFHRVKDWRGVYQYLI